MGFRARRGRGSPWYEGPCCGRGPCGLGIQKLLLRIRARPEAAATQEEEEEVRCQLSEILARRIQTADDLVAGEEEGCELHEPVPGLHLWAEGNPQQFRLRCGPRYRRLGRKARPGPALYRCAGVDVAEGTRQIRSALAGAVGSGKLLEAAPQARAGRLLPEVIIVHFQLPFQAGPIYGQHPPDDNGCSVIVCFAATEEARLLDKDAASGSPGVQLLARYLREEGHPFTEGSYVSGCLKVVGVLENLDDLDIPSAMKPVVRRFNGKPVLVERDSKRYWAVERPDIVELTIDIRGFNPLARSMLRRLRGQLQRAVIQLGILIQGCEDSELPEQLLGAVRLSHLDLLGGRRVEVAANLCEQAAFDLRDWGLARLLRGRLGHLWRALRCGGRRREAAELWASVRGGAGPEPPTPWFTPRSRAGSQ